jgi:hypothetical protein
MDYLDFLHPNYATELLSFFPADFAEKTPKENQRESAEKNRLIMNRLRIQS